MRRIGVEERRARLAVRHHLSACAPGPDVAGVARSLVALHSTDPASVFLSVRARAPMIDIDAIERALYEDRSVVRMLGMRRTVFVVPVELVPVVHMACTQALVPGERRKAVTFLEGSGVEDGEVWLRRAQDDTMDALLARGEATAAELSAAVPELRRQVRVGAGTKWEGVQGMSSRVLFLLAAEGRIARGRPRGSWISSQYRWAPMEAWLPDRGPDPTVEAARTELARRWLRAFGPATLADLKWWTGLTMGEVKRAITPLGTVEVEIDGRTGMVLPDDLEPVPAPEPWAALLPALDPTVMGWQERGWYLGEHRAALFDRSGNAGPSVWWEGRIVGAWAQRADREIAIRLLEDVGADAERAIECEAHRLAAWLGPVKVAARFRTTAELELSS